MIDTPVAACTPQRIIIRLKPLCFCSHPHPHVGRGAIDVQHIHEGHHPSVCGVIGVCVRGVCVCVCGCVAGCRTAGAYAFYLTRKGYYVV